MQRRYVRSAVPTDSRFVCVCGLGRMDSRWSEDRMQMKAKPRLPEQWSSGAKMLDLRSGSRGLVIGRLRSKCPNDMRRFLYVAL